MVMLMIILFFSFETAIVDLLSQVCNCFSHRRKIFADTEKPLNDYYKEIHVNFLISEFERCIVDKDHYEMLITNADGDKDVIKILQT